MHIGYNARMTGWLLLTSALTLGFCLLASGYVSQTVAEMQNSLVQVENAQPAKMAKGPAVLAGPDEPPGRN